MKCKMSEILYQQRLGHWNTKTIKRAPLYFTYALVFILENTINN